VENEKDKALKRRKEKRRRAMKHPSCTEVALKHRQRYRPAFITTIWN
jgi:hypothetical protein